MVADNLVVFYINLDGREDKNIVAKNQLQSTSLPFQRISAVNYTEISDSKIPYKYFRLVSAVKKSHIKACREFMDTSYPMALILEDDFKLDLLNFRADLDEVSRLMQKKGINFLQVGHLTYIESAPKNSIFETHMRRLFEYAYRSVYFLRFPLSPIMPRQIRWGAQAYIVDRKGAFSLINLLNTENQAPIDVELRNLSKIDLSHENYFSMASLKKNLIRQNLLFKSDTQGVV